MRTAKIAWTLRVWAICVGVALLFARAPFAAATLPHLHGIDDVRNWFNGAKGYVRLILLLSPT